MAVSLSAIFFGGPRTCHAAMPRHLPPKHPETAYIGIGSNLGDRRRNCLRAIKMIGEIPETELTGGSEWYLTEPVGVTGQDWYVNGVVSIRTSISPQRLLRELQGIEMEMGRMRKERWDPRIVDLDILLYGHEIIHDEDLRVPHPRMHLRRFVLVPLSQLAPDLIHPSLGLSVAQLLRNAPDDGQRVVPLKDT